MRRAAPRRSPPRRRRRARGKVRVRVTNQVKVRVRVGLAEPPSGALQADSSEAGQYYAKVMAKIEKAPDFVSKEVARLTKMKVSKSAVSQQVSSK